jgi:hypothetical protein
LAGRRVGWRLQALAESDLSDRARARAAELARNADPRPAGSSRLPGPGTVLTRRYKGAEVRVKIAADGFEYQGERYDSLRAVAKAVTGTHTNGFPFFRLNRGDAA